jgi:6-phosphogluconolactonase (cycloisomerase 2 family)
MKLSRIGRISMAFVVSVAMGLGMTACGGGTIGFMWVMGTQYNQIAGFKIDDFTGNLTAIPHSPFSASGSNPEYMVVKPGGRFAYVVNEGSLTPPTDPNAVCSTSTGSGGNIAQFLVGGEGVLTFQQPFFSQGCTPVWASIDSSGGFLYVLDKYAPGVKFSACTAPGASAATCFGDLTVFSIDANSGRLTLVVNQQQQVPGTQNQLTYFPVGFLPAQVRVGAGCVFTMDLGDQSIFPYTAGSGGQLIRSVNSAIPTGATRLTSIAVNGSSIYLTDAGQPNTPGLILPYTVGSSCALSTANGGAVSNLSTASNPTFSMTDANNKYLYVLNQSTTNSSAPSYSSISAFTIDPTSGKLLPVVDVGNNPYKVGSGPVCMVEDPTKQYIYTSNGVDGTVTGFVIDNSNGSLSDLKRGSTFAATGQATCLAVSGNVD